MFEIVNEICEKILLFNLHETSRFQIENLIDNFNDTKFEFFLNDFRNDLHAIQN